jgi:hypothetical protein
VAGTGGGTPPDDRARPAVSVVRGVGDDAQNARNARARRARDVSGAMRRSDSLTHIEQAMSSVKSLRGRGLELPNTPRLLRRKHRCAMRDDAGRCFRALRASIDDARGEGGERGRSIFERVDKSRRRFIRRWMTREDDANVAED